MEELGNPEINTLEDLSDVLGMAKEKYPDLIPVIMNSNWKGSYIKNQVGAYDGFNLTDDGTIVYSIQTDTTKEYYRVMNEFYRKGYIIADNYSFQNEDESYQYAYNGQCFAYMKHMAVIDELNFEAEEMGKDFTWTMLAKSLTENTSYYNTIAGWSGMFISRNCETPDTAIKFAQYMLSDEGMKTALWGIEGEDWEMTDEGYPEFFYDTNDTDYKYEIGAGQFGLFGDNAVVESIGAYDPTRTEFIAGATEAKSKTVYIPAIGLLQPEADSDEMTMLTKLKEMITNTEVKVIMAETEEKFEEEYQAMLDLAAQIGIDDLNEWATAKYTEVAKLIP
jgi:putative aldouronate transport system substrate-binding protein